MREGRGAEVEVEWWLEKVGDFLLESLHDMCMVVSPCLVQGGGELPGVGGGRGGGCDGHGAEERGGGSGCLPSAPVAWQLVVAHAAGFSLVDLGAGEAKCQRGDTGGDQVRAAEANGKEVMVPVEEGVARAEKTLEVVFTNEGAYLECCCGVRAVTCTSDDGMGTGASAAAGGGGGGGGSMAALGLVTCGFDRRVRLLKP